MVSFNGRFVSPGKIVCVGRNYVAHIEELGNEVPDSMVLFMKAPSCVSDTLNSSHLNEEVHYEGEIAFIIESGKISGVGFGLDLTKRGLQSKLKEKSLPWERAKSFDGAALFSPFVKTEDTKDLRMKLFINDELIQDGVIDHMMYKPDTILEEINSFSKLEDFDVVMSGTPKGVGVVKKGDKFVGQIFSEEKLLIEKEWIAN